MKINHHICDIYNIKNKKMDDVDYVEDMFAHLTAKHGLHVENDLAHKFPKQGLTYIMILGESSLVYEAYPESEYANISVMTCGVTADGRALIDELILLLDGKGSTKTISHRQPS